MTQGPWRFGDDGDARHIAFLMSVFILTAAAVIALWP